jgi:pimeloyl-ACP methyl ester carboxylesterase
MTVELGHETMGSGEPLVMLHGLFGSRRNWLSIIRPLSEDLQVVAVDLRNHGSSGHAATMSFAEMADDVAALADRLGLDRVNVAGHSLGGKVAMLFALRHPSRTRRLLVLDVAPVPYRGPFGRYIDAMLAMPLAQMRTRQEAEEALAPAVPQAAVRQFLLHNLVRDGNGFRWRPNLEALRTNLDELSGFPEIPAGTTYEGPASFLAGGRSDYLRPEHLPLIRQLFPRASLEVIPDAGHWLHADQPEAVLHHMRTFLAAPEGQ